MKILLVVQILFVVSKKYAVGLSSEELTEVTDLCCPHGESFGMSDTVASEQECSGIKPPDDVEPEQLEACLSVSTSCCEQQIRKKDECIAGMKYAPSKQCSTSKTDIGKTCCEECSFGRWTGKSQGKDACGEPSSSDVSPNTALRKNAFRQCCLEAANTPETTTEKKEIVKSKCKANSCEHICKDDDGAIRCECRSGYKLHVDKKSCTDINECAEIIDDLCTKEDTVCHNTPGSYKCVPIKKRDLGLNCPPGFRWHMKNQVCDDINECQLPRPPCPKYLCKNTVGGYLCDGKPGKPITEGVSGLPPATTVNPKSTSPAVEKNDICPQGFRAGPGDECVDIEECEEHLDDCQRLSQHCINTHGGFFCQDHVSKRCAPGFKVNPTTGICEDIDECEESSEVCKRNEICVNLPGAYNCKSKISTLPRFPKRTCQEGTRMKPGGTVCEDIDECLEGTHLCDPNQKCINTFGGHECHCKDGFELDITTSNCADINECTMKMDNCKPNEQCVNLEGSFKCLPRPITTSTTTSPPEYEYEYYDEDENSSSVAAPIPHTPALNSTSTSTTTPNPALRTTVTSSTPRPSLYPYYGNQPPESARPTNPPSTTTQRTLALIPRRPNYPTRPAFTEVTVTKPNDTVTIEKDKSPDGGYEIDTNEIPKDKWTNVIGRDKPDEPVDIDNIHCLYGFEKNSNGECVDVNECQSGMHVCSSLEVCRNRPGGYVCECITGFRRDSSGWCVVATTTTSTPSIPRNTTSLRTTATSRITTTRRTTTTTPTATTLASRTPVWSYTPRPRRPAISCELGYTFDKIQQKCIDIDECKTNKANCSPNEDCVNIEGGYRCLCGSRCRSDNETPVTPPTSTYVAPPRRTTTDSNVITVGAQFGQRGSMYTRPRQQRVHSSGSVTFSCQWGYTLSPDKRCVDIDECAQNTSQCGPQQRCENFYGGYSCQCPAGHRLVGQDSCEDVDECAYGHPCPYNSKCINTIGSYQCQCGEGFQNAATNDKVCVDVDECVETPSVCEQGCANAWGGYRCYCQRGYRLHTDNRTCVDVDECAEWSAARVRGRLCAGDCVNTPGSYRCACPPGYRIADDERSCIDIDECENGEASCAHSLQGDVCQNTRGGYHCHRIDCPPGYRFEAKHRCTRVQRMCQVSDWECLQQPSSYSYNFITFVSNIYLPMGSVDLFTMHGPSWSDSIVRFEMKMVKSQSQSSSIRSADLSCFDMRPNGNVCAISLVCSLQGPQVVELELAMSLYQRGHFAGSAVARLVVIVSQYEF